VLKKSSIAFLPLIPIKKLKNVNANLVPVPNNTVNAARMGNDAHHYVNARIVVT
jgi:hypothetical protein